MSDGMNKVILLGNLGADPELRYTPTGVAVLSIRLATNESWRDKNKEVQERTEWHTVIVWGARAEALSRILNKGSSVLIEGGLRTSSYEKDGQTRYKTEVHAREVLFTGRRVTHGPRDVAMALGADGADGDTPGLARVPTNGFGPAKKPADPLDDLPY
jgi:single-strand DNA-binding protein